MPLGVTQTLVLRPTHGPMGPEGSPCLRQLLQIFPEESGGVRGRCPPPSPRKQSPGIGWQLPGERRCTLLTPVPSLRSWQAGFELPFSGQLAKASECIGCGSDSLGSGGQTYPLSPEAGRRGDGAIPA